MKFSKWANILKLILLKIVEEIERRINEKNGVDTSDTFSNSIYTSLKFIILEQVDGMVDEVISYSKNQVNSLADLIAQKLSVILSSLVYVLMQLALFLFILVFLFIALALYLGKLMGEMYYGFLATGGLIIIMMLLVYIFGQKSIAKSIKNQFLKAI